MTAIDLGIAGLILLSAVIGLWRGLAKELLSLLIWLGAFVLALWFARAVAMQLFPGVENEPVRLALGFALVFVLTVVVGAMVQWLVARLITGSGLTGTDRFLGFLFGTARGGLVCVVGLVAMRPFLSEYPWWHDSSLIPELMAFEQEVLELIQTLSAWVSASAT